MLNGSLKNLEKSMVDQLPLDIVVMVQMSLRDYYYQVLMIRVFGLSSAKLEKKRILLQNLRKGWLRWRIVENPWGLHLLFNEIHWRDISMLKRGKQLLSPPQ